MSEELVKKEEFNVFSIMDQLDDKLIIGELEGKLPDVLTYHFTDRTRNKEIWGLSKSGVDEASGELAKKGEVIREIDLQYTIQEDEAFFICKVARFLISKEGKEVMLDVKVGSKRQPKKDQYGKLNPFWFEQGATKASRNATMRLIPATIKEAVIEYAKKQGKVKEVKTPNGDFTQESKTSYITDAQRKRLFAIVGDSGIKESELKLYLKNIFDIESSKDILKTNYDEICKWAGEQKPGQEG